MAPTIAKTRKSKGVVALIPHSKRTKKAGSNTLATPLTMNQSNDKEVPVSVHEDFSQKLDPLIKVVTDLSTQLAANEGCEWKGKSSSTNSPPTSSSPDGGTREHLLPIQMYLSRSTGVWLKE